MALVQTLALSYFSKPPGIAFLQFRRYVVVGDTQFGVRFFSPVFAAILSIVVLRFRGSRGWRTAGLCAFAHHYQWPRF
jgi:4-amino-4-deoxy-L-arabinose transferase-like glycosyltransferase